MTLEWRSWGLSEEGVLNMEEFPIADFNWRRPAFFDCLMTPWLGSTVMLLPVGVLRAAGSESAGGSQQLAHPIVMGRG
jgi:hypothetical protein